MADAESTSNAPESKTTGLDEIRDKMESELNTIKEQLASMNQQYSQGLEAIKSAVKPAPSTEVSDEDFFNPRELRAKVLSEATSVADSMIKEERRKNAVIYQLAQEYPEIQSDAALQKAILAEQSKLPQAILDTADGYEMAVLKAISKKGIIPKSKRPVVDEDIASGSGRSGGRSQDKKAKLSDKTVMVAELLRGRQLTAEELQSLEETSKRDTYGRYR